MKCELFSLWFETKRACYVFWVSGLCLDDKGNADLAESDASLRNSDLRQTDKV